MPLGAVSTVSRFSAPRRLLQRIGWSLLLLFATIISLAVALLVGAAAGVAAAIYSIIDTFRALVRDLRKVWTED
jgi:hypothetical protein